MPDDELAKLADDIKANGLHHPIVLLDEQVLDGADRQRACEQAGVTPLYEEFGGDDPRAFVLSMNRHRKHLDDRHLVFICAELAKLPRGGNGNNQHGAKLVNTRFASGRKTIPDIAKVAGIPVYDINDAKTVLDKGTAEIIELTRSKKVGLRAAADYVRQTPKDQQVPEQSLIKRRRTAKGRHTTTAGDSKAAREVREHVRPLVEQGDMLNVQDVVEATGHSRIVTEAAIAFERGRVEGLAEASERAPTEPEPLPKTAQEKLAVAEKRLHAQLEAEFEQRVRDELRRRLEARDEEDTLAIEQANALLAHSTGRLRPPFTAEQYHQLLWALHPDNRDPAKVTAAFILIRQKKAVLCDDGPIQRKSSFAPLPKTLEELKAMRQKRQA
jgi:hypothetical protein